MSASERSWCWPWSHDWELPGVLWQRCRKCGRSRYVGPETSWETLH